MNGMREDTSGAPSDRPCSLPKCRLIPLLIRTPVRLEWSHDQRQQQTSTPQRTPLPGCSAFARDRRAAADAAEVDLLRAAVRLGGPAPGGVDPGRGSRHGDKPVPVAGPGAPLVAEFCVAEFAAAVGLPTETGKAYLGEALELRHRLPKTWARVGPVTCRRGGPAGSPARPSGSEPGGGGVRGRPGRAVRAPDPAHRGGPAGGGGDRPVHAGGGPASPGGRRGWPARPRAHRSGVLRGHRVGAGRGRPGRRPGPRHRPVGRCRPAGRPRLHRVAGRAPLRSARGDGAAPARPGPRHRDQSPAPGREVVLHVHLTEQAIAAPEEKLHLARVANTRSFVDADQVRAWCGHPGATVTVRPVVDLTEHIARRAVPGPRPARPASSRAGPDLCVPVVHPPRGGLRPGPRDPLHRGRTDGSDNIGPSVAGTTGSRPTTPAGATPSWNPAPTCGPRRTATSSCATTPAPPTSPATGPSTHPTGSDPAPHPAPAHRRGATGVSDLSARARLTAFGEPRGRAARPRRAATGASRC